jgi:hypothetical protein
MLYLINNKKTKIKVMNTTTTKQKGRPVVEGSKRQAVLAKRAERAAAGYEIKRGRPKTIKADADNEMLDIEVELEA